MRYHRNARWSFCVERWINAVESLTWPVFQCSASCGDGVQRRQVLCQAGRRESGCPPRSRPSSSRSCRVAECRSAYWWREGDWQTVSWGRRAVPARWELWLRGWICCVMCDEMRVGGGGGEERSCSGPITISCSSVRIGYFLKALQIECALDRHTSLFSARFKRFCGFCLSSKSVRTRFRRWLSDCKLMLMMIDDIVLHIFDFFSSFLIISKNEIGMNLNSCEECLRGMAEIIWGAPAVEATVSYFVHWKGHPRGHYLAFYLFEEYPEGHFVPFYLQEGHPRGHFIVFVSTGRVPEKAFYHKFEWHHRGHFVTFCLLDGHPKGHFIMLFMLERHLSEVTLAKFISNTRAPAEKDLLLALRNSKSAVWLRQQLNWLNSCCVKFSRLL